jgi:hypothetical protein
LLKASKKIFLLLAVVFASLLIWASYDISRRTTFPGSKPQLKERLKKQLDGRDSTRDSVPGNSSLKSAA